MPQKLVFTHAAHSGYAAQLRAEALVSQRALIFYGKAVRFLLNIAYERKHRRICGKSGIGKPFAFGDLPNDERHVGLQGGGPEL